MFTLLRNGSARSVFPCLAAASIEQQTDSTDPRMWPRVVIVLGGGGHTTEILHLVELMGPSYEYHYLLATADNHSASKIRRSGLVHRVPRPRYRPGKRTQIILDPWLSLRCLLATLPLLWRVRPAALLTAGPSIGVITGLAARLLGVRVIFFETGSRITTLSGTGKAMRFIANDFFVQSPRLLQHVSRARYAGRLW
jgi:UDP-N-acetylglucosamine:LPS N-acetylglucosamine transferase